MFFIRAMGLMPCFMIIESHFDAVSHKILIYKFRQYGVEQMQLKWVEDFLATRKSNVGGMKQFLQLERGLEWSTTRVCYRTIAVLATCELPEIIKSNIKIFANYMKPWKIEIS
jgi:hypothetical protein